MRTKYTLITGVFSSISMSLMVSMPTYGQESDAEKKGEQFYLEEVVVTARKRFEMQQDVPISLLAVTGDKIQNSNILKMEELSAQIPNVHVAESTIGNQLFVRGIGSGTNQSFEQTVGTYVDGLYLGRGQLTRIPFYDLERIEVLKGPQGILFGKNTVAGALSVTTIDPTEEFEAYVTGLYEVEHEEHNVTGAVSGAIAENMRGRVAFRVSGMDGWMDNTEKNRDEPNTAEESVRFSFAWDPSDDLEVVVKASKSKLEVDGRNTQMAHCSDELQQALSVKGFYDDCKENDKKSSDGTFIAANNGPGGFDYSKEEAETDIDTFGISVDWAIGENTISFITGYVAYDLYEVTDGEFTALSMTAGTRTEEFDQWSQEIRWASPVGETFEHLLGVYYQSTELQSGGDAHISVDSDIQAVLALPLSIAGTRMSRFDQDASSVAIFGQSTWNITEELRITGGLRYSEEEKDVIKDQVIAELGQSVESADALLKFAFETALNSDVHTGEEALQDSRSENNLSPSLNVQWDMDENAMFYATVSQGFKGGGFDAQLANSADIENYEYEEEEVTAFELGAKLRLLDGAAVLNAALFRSDFSDVQISTYDGALGFLVTNAGETRAQGIELDGRWRALENLELGGAFAFLDAEYLKFDDAQCYANQELLEPENCTVNADGDLTQDLSGRETQFSPEYSAHLFAEYTAQLSDSLHLFSLLEASYVDEYAIANDLDPNLYQDAYTKWNLRVALVPDTDQWELAFIGKNLTDETTSTYGSDVPLFTGSIYRHTDRSRSYALQGTWRF